MLKVHIDIEPEFHNITYDNLGQKKKKKSDWTLKILQFLLLKLSVLYNIFILKFCIHKLVPLSLKVTFINTSWALING